MVSPSFVGTTSFSRSLPVCVPIPYMPTLAHWTPISHAEMHIESIFSGLRFLMKRSRMYLTAVFICDLPVTPERSHPPSISCAHRDAQAIELAQISTTGAAWSLASRGSTHRKSNDRAAGSTQPHFKVSFSDKKKRCSIHKPVFGLESCRFNGNVLLLRSYISRSHRGGHSLLVLPYPFSFPNLLVCPGI